MADNTKAPVKTAASPAVKEAAKEVVSAVADAVDKVADEKASDKPTPKAGKPKAYISTTDTYVGGRYFKAGEPFVTGEPKGENWEVVDDEAKAAAEAAQPFGAGDPPLEDMDLAGLKAFANTKNVRTDGLDKEGILNAIRAAKEPRL